MVTLVPLPPIAPLGIPYCKPRRPDLVPVVACIKEEEEEEEEEEEAVFISVVNTNEDPPNAHQAQHRPVQATGAMSA